MGPQPRLFRTTAVCSLLIPALLLALGGLATAQLAGGPSPMYHHDERHTGQSHLLGPLFAPGAPAAADVKFWQGTDKIRTSPALSADGSTLYVGQGFDFYAIDTATMATNWRFRLHADVSDSSPAVGTDGTIYIGDRDNTFSAFNPNGTIKFQINHGYEGDVWTHPVIGPATLPAPHQRGTIYYAHDQSTEGVGIFRAVNPNGTEKWKYTIGNFVRQSSPTIDASGIIYLGDLQGYLHAFKDNGQGNVERIWKYRVGSSTPGLTASPVISADSTTLYIGTSSAIPGIPLGLTALDITNPACFSSTLPACNPIRWTFATAGRVDQTPALAADGTLYVPAMDRGQKRLYAVNPNGTQKWVFGPISSGSETSAYPIVGADGVVYVGIQNGIYALSPAAGTKLWAYQTTNFIQAMPVIDGPSLGGTGTAIIYVPSRDTRIYKISASRETAAGGPPGAATLVSPTGMISTATPTYTWSAVSGATNYLLWVNDSSAAPKINQVYTAAAAGCAAGTGTCAVTPGTALAAGAGRWWIQTSNGVGTGPWSASLDFTVSGGGGLPGAAMLGSPAGMIGTTTPTYTWNAVAGATFYYLWVNDSSAAPKITQWYSASDAGCGAGTGSCAVTPSTALAVGAGRWWIQTWNAAGYGPWSTALDFTVAGGAPAAATLVSPTGTIGTATPTYTWNAVPGATHYYLWVNDSSAAPKITQWYSASDAGCGAGTGSCAVTPSTALAVGAGRWWIQTWNAAGYGPWSVPLDFTR